MSIQVTVMSAIRKGIVYIDDIAKEYGIGHVPIYNAGRELIKKKEIYQPVPGIHGAFCLMGHEFVSKNKAEVKQLCTEKQKVEVQERKNEIQKVEAPKSGFNFTEHFNNLVELMAAKITMDVEARVRENLGPLASQFSEELLKTVEAASESILGKIANKAMLQSEVIQQPPKAHEEKKAVSRLPKVCVANLKPVQCGEISSEFGQTFDLVFWNGKTGNSTQQLMEFSKNCDVVFWHTSHSSHSAEAMVKKAGGNLVRVSGALSQMRKALLDYYTHTAVH